MAELGFEPRESESRTLAFGYYLMHSKDRGQLPRGTAAEFFTPVASEYPYD